MPVPSAMLVAVPPEVASELTGVLGSLIVLKVGHIAAACERMLATWPLILIVGGRQKASGSATLRATAVDIKAEVVMLDAFAQRALRDQAIATAIAVASASR